MLENASHDNGSINVANGQETVDDMTAESVAHETAEAFTNEQPTMEESTTSELPSTNVVVVPSSDENNNVEETASQTISYVSSSQEDESTIAVTTSTTSASMSLSPMVSTSTVFLDKAFKTIAASREAKRSKELAESTQKAIGKGSYKHL
jgi:hypothetical protein